MPPDPPTSSRDGAKRAASKLNPAAAKLGRTLSDAAAEKADQNKASVSTTASIRVDVSGASRLRRAIWGMMPTNKLRYQRMTRLRLYPTAAHTHEAQFRAADGKAFRAVTTADDGTTLRKMQLQRIQPAALAGNIE